MASALVLSVLFAFACLVTAEYSGSSYPANAGGKNVYRVNGIVADPYLTATNTQGKNGGAIVDILEAMKAESAGQFDYKLTARKDNQYGDSVNGVNTGLVKDLVDGTIDIAAADFSVLKSRHSVIDYLQPYVRSQIRIAVNNVNGVLGDNPTIYVSRLLSVQNVLKNSKNSTLQNFLKSAQTSNNIVKNAADGVAKLLANSGPAALIDETPGLSSLVNQNSDKLSLTSDIISSQYFAFGIAQKRDGDRLKLNLLLLSIQEKGILQGILNKYDLN